MAEHNTIGSQGEEMARTFLVDNGYKIIDTNYQTRRAEIDIIAKDEDELVFIEVRTKKNDRFGTPADTINRDKLMRLERNADAWVHRKNYTGPYRIDVIGIILQPTDTTSSHTPSITHYENITSY